MIHLKCKKLNSILFLEYPQGKPVPCRSASVRNDLSYGFLLVLGHWTASVILNKKVFKITIKWLSELNHNLDLFFKIMVRLGFLLKHRFPLYFSPSPDRLLKSFSPVSVCQRQSAGAPFGVVCRNLFCDHKLLLSYAQCKSACLWTGRHAASPCLQFFFSWAMWRCMPFHLLI